MNDEKHMTPGEGGAIWLALIFGGLIASIGVGNTSTGLAFVTLLVMWGAAFYFLDKGMNGEYRREQERQRKFRERHRL